MDRQNIRSRNRLLRFFLPAIVTGLLLPAGFLRTVASDDELSWSLKEQLFLPLEKWIEQLEQSKNADGIANKRGTMSRTPRKLDDTTYQFGVHVNTAEEFRQVTERYLVTLKKEGSRWKITEKEVVDTKIGLYRESGAKCYPFDKFKFDREGLTLTATNGTVCEEFLEGEVSAFVVHADKLSHHYQPPEHAAQLPIGRDYRALHQLMTREHLKELFFDAPIFVFQCDVRTCDKLLTESFEGLERIAPEERADVRYGKDDEILPDWVKPLIKDTLKNRRDRPFADFRVLDSADHTRFSVLIPRNMELNSGIFLVLDSWRGWEVQFGVLPERFDLPNQLIGPVFGYYSQQTIEQADLYQLERRPDGEGRWFEVHSVKGKVDLAVDEPDMLQADIEFGLTLRQDAEELPFLISSNRGQGALGASRLAPVFVNSVQLEGQELTWVRTGPTSGRIILPQKQNAGAKIMLRMGFSTRAIIKRSDSYSYVNRSGWLPFVRWGDMIDEFELTLRSPSKYTIYGDGHKLEETVEGDIRISRWKAEFPINDPAVIFGKYRTDKAKFDATKADGKTVIPVHVSVDEASFAEWDIRESTLRPIAEQAVNAINLYTAISGVEYPFGELNLVNDPLGFLYGQSSGAITYLGSGVFWAEGRLASLLPDPTSNARFKRSVVAHEIGHKWWGTMISHANSRHRWYRESLSEYFSALYLEFAFGYEDYLEQVDEWRRNLLKSNLKANVQNAQSLFSGEWGGGETERDSQTVAVYDKGAYVFHMLRETFRDPRIEERGPNGSDSRFFTFLKLFTQELAAKREIVTLDIQRAAESGLGGTDQQGNRVNVDLGWFFDQWIRGSGIPRFTLRYDVRRAEGGGYVVDGVIKQRVVLGYTKSATTLEDQLYRGIVYVSAKAKGGTQKQRVIINAPETPFQFNMPNKPFEVVLNEDGEMLALDVAEK